MNRWSWMIAVAALFVGSPAVADDAASAKASAKAKAEAKTDAAPITPEETVRRYMQAIQDREFDEAWNYVSEGMKQGRTKEAYVKESQYVVSFSEFKIFDFKVYSGKIEGDVAKVPNLLSSQDKFLNQLGVDEHAYKLVKEDGHWKVDHQEIVITKEEKAQWFPSSE